MFHASEESSVETHFLHLTHRQGKNVAQKKRDKNVARQRRKQLSTSTPLPTPLAFHAITGMSA